MWAPSDLPADTVTALQDALTPFCEDTNGDGKVVVQVDTYNVDFDADECEHRRLQPDGRCHPAERRAFQSGGKTYIFLLEDPAAFESPAPVRCNTWTAPSPTTPRPPTPTGREMVYRWTDCPVLAGLELGDYDGLHPGGRRHRHEPERAGCTCTWGAAASGTKSRSADLRGLRRAVGHPDRRGCLHRRRMSRALPPLKGHLRKKVQPRPKTPPLPDNPYKRFFTKDRSFEELAR